MSEAAELAAGLSRLHNPPAFADFTAARTWVVSVWPDWREWVGEQMLDNVAEAILAAPRRSTTTGTAHFINRAAAIAYYADYGSDAADVDRKISEAEIHIGAPQVKAGESLVLLDNGRRYGIREG